MRERVHIFGSERHLVGIHTEAEAVADAGERRQGPTVVYLNAGLLHRVGPYRLHVDLARELAGHGFPGFRFDMTGIGDSAVTPGGLSGDARYAADVSEALQFLADEHGARRFILFGLCSGADFAHVGAVADDRVVGAVLLDAYGYPTTGFYLRHYGSRISSPRRVARFLARRYGERLARQRLEPRGVEPPGLDPDELDVFGRAFPPRGKVAAELRTLLARGIKLYYVYTGGQSYFNHRGQFRAMFPGLAIDGAVQVDYAPRVDHTYTLLGDRRRLQRRVGRWLRQQFPASEWDVHVRAAPGPEPVGPDEPGDRDADGSPDDPDDDTESFVF